MERLCIQSFLDKGHSFTLYSYSHLEVPQGTRIRDASEVVPWPGESIMSSIDMATFADFFRYSFLYNFGGWWVDLDVFCLAKQIPDINPFFAREDANYINNAVLRFNANHPLIGRCLDACDGLENLVAAKRGNYGPRLITRLSRDLGYDSQAQPMRTCYPVHWMEYQDFFDENKLGLLVERTKESFMVHLWGNMLSKAGIDRNAYPKQNTFLEWIASQQDIPEKPRIS